MPTITTQGTTNPTAEQAKIAELRDNPAVKTDEVLGQGAVQEAIGKMPAPPPMRQDLGGDVRDSAEGDVKTDPKGKKSLADGRVIHYGSTQPRSKVEVDTDNRQTPLEAAMGVLPAGGQLRYIEDEAGETIAYRVIDPEDTVSSFIWPNDEGTELEVSGPLAKRVGKLVK